MTVPNETSLSGPYSGNGVTTSFGYGFLVLSSDHLRVVITRASGALSELVVGVDFTVSGVGNPAGGGVTLAVAPVVGEKVTILRTMPFTQQTDLENQGAFHAQTVEDALDMGVMRDQLLKALVKNAIHAPDVEAVNMELPAAGLRANKYMLFDANGAPTYVNSQVDARYYGSAAVDPLTRPDGSARQAADLYFNTAGSKFRVFTGTSWTDALPTANLTLVNYREVSATAKTTFTVAGGYQAGSVFVYLNGVLLDTSEYTASNGTTVVLSSACAIGDELRCVSFSNFSVADTLARSNNLGDLPSAGTALTNLGLTDYGKSVIYTTDAAGLRTLLALAFGATAAKATTAQAQVGADDTTLMTPSKTVDAINSLVRPNVKEFIFETSGTFTPSATGKFYEIIVIGGGGGGGNGANGNNNANATNNGGDGGWGAGGGGIIVSGNREQIGNAGITVTVGAGGAALSAGGGSSFGGYVSANGGNSGTSGGTNSTGASANIPGTASTNLTANQNRTGSTGGAGGSSLKPYSVPAPAAGMKGFCGAGGAGGDHGGVGSPSNFTGAGTGGSGIVIVREYS